MEEEPVDMAAVLPACLWERILLLLDVRDVVACGRASRRLRELALGETLWRQLVDREWGGTATCPARWLTAQDACGHFPRQEDFPGTYRALYPVLRAYGQLVGGVWLDGDGRRLCVFEWRRDCLEGSHLRFTDMAGPPEATPVHRLTADGESSAVFLDAGHCWIRQHRVQRPSCRYAQAAAQVACGSLEERQLCSSPTGSFEHELLRFMEANVGQRRRKSRSKSPGTQRSPQAEFLRQSHLRRLHLSPPTRAHPLSGLWRGDFGPSDGVQLVSFWYSFADDCAAINARKVVACYRGNGRLGDSQEVCDGMLWRYADGDIGFVWLPDPDTDDWEAFLVDFKRVDAL